VWWLGQSSFLLQWQGHHLLFDPYLSDSLTHKYATTDKPHVRMTEIAITPQQLGYVQTVTCSHITPIISMHKPAPSTHCQSRLRLRHSRSQSTVRVRQIGLLTRLAAGFQ
jgi:hypothetical protein